MLLFEMKSLAIYTCQTVTRYGDWKVLRGRELWSCNGSHAEQQGVSKVTRNRRPTGTEASDSDFCLRNPLTLNHTGAPCLLSGKPADETLDLNILKLIFFKEYDLFK